MTKLLATLVRTNVPKQSNYNGQRELSINRTSFEASNRLSHYFIGWHCRHAVRPRLESRTALIVSAWCDKQNKFVLNADCGDCPYLPNSKSEQPTSRRSA